MFFFCNFLSAETTKNAVLIHSTFFVPSTGFSKVTNPEKIGGRNHTNEIFDKSVKNDGKMKHEWTWTIWILKNLKLEQKTRKSSSFF